MHVVWWELASGALLLIACGSPHMARGRRPYAEDRIDRPVTAVAQGCSPGMSCFGHVVVLPNGEVAEAATTAAAATAATAAATATATAAVQGAKDSKTKDKGKSAEKAKADAKTQVKRRITCELRGGGVKPQPWMKLKCRYWCPGDPPTSFREVLLSVDECPRLWDFDA